MMVSNASNKAVIVDVLHLSVVRLAAAVHETLSPFMTEMRQDLAAVKTEIKEDVAAVKTEMKEDVAAVKENMTRILADINSKLDSLDSSVSQNFSVRKTRLQEHNSQTASAHHDIDSKLDSLDSKQDGLNMTVMTVNSELEHNVLTNVTKELKETADYIIEQFPPYGCGGTGGWRRVVYLNMTDPNTNCPSGWNLTTYSKRTCGKVNTSSLSCDSVFFPVSEGHYTSSIRAYQYSHTDAFEAYHDGNVTTIEGAYVAGVSLTHGGERQHIWTFAAGYSEDRSTRDDACPCDASINITIPPFVGGDYFCESGDNSGFISGFHPDDPLWDGEGCSSSSSCCSFNNPPYFTKQLPSPTSDPIEARLCQLDTSDGDDSPVEFMELYVK